MFFASIALLGLALLSTAFPTGKLQRRQDQDGVFRHCIVPNTAALTFDDGPFWYAKNISDTLKKAGAKGTFFYNVKNFDCIYNSDETAHVKYVYSQGHQLASHTGNHPNLTYLSHDEIHDQMWRSEQAIWFLTGAYPAITRPPYGASNALVVKVAAERGQKLVTWDFDSGDTSKASVEQQKQRYDDIIARHPGTILTLNHETHESTALEVLPYAIQKLQAAGYRLVTVAECLGLEPYKAMGPPSKDIQVPSHC